MCVRYKIYFENRITTCFAGFTSVAGARALYSFHHNSYSAAFYATVGCLCN